MFIRPSTEKALAAAVTRLIAPMARVAYRNNMHQSREKTESVSLTPTLKDVTENREDARVKFAFTRGLT